MKWENLMSLISGLLNCYGLPHAIMIHCGGNDIGNSKTPCGLLIHQMKVAFAYILFEITWYRNYLVEYVAKTEVVNFT
jgi:hypothetical protein